MPYIGLAAFAMVMPITVSLLVVLGFLILSYRQTIKAYPSAGGAYIVTRDNFGLLPAQVAGVALLTDYVLTVSVSVAAGTAALSSAFPALAHYAVPVSVFFIVLIAYGNLRGVQGVGPHLRRPHLLLHRRHGGAAGHRVLPHGLRTSAGREPPPARARQDRHRRATGS